MKLTFGVASFCFLTALCTTAAAQPEPPAREPSQAQIDEARRVFVEGAAAVESGRWADAISAFTRAYELSGVPPALYNVAFALRALGRHVEARNAFEALLLRHRDELEPEMRQLSETYVGEERSRVARLVLEGLDPELRHDVRLDGNRVDDHLGRPLEVEADPGQHTVTAQAEGFLPFTWEGRLSDGQRLSVFVELEPLPSEGGSIFSSPVFWVITGIVVLAGAAVTGYILYENAQLDCEVAERCYPL